MVRQSLRDVIGCTAKKPKAVDLPSCSTSNATPSHREDGTPILIPQWLLGPKTAENRGVLEETVRVSLQKEVCNTRSTKREFTLYEPYDRRSSNMLKKRKSKRQTSTMQHCNISRTLSPCGLSLRLLRDVRL